MKSRGEDAAATRPSLNEQADSTRCSALHSIVRGRGRVSKSPIGGIPEPPKSSSEALKIQARSFLRAKMRARSA